MDSLSELAFYLAKYGYMTIFILVFLQQIGVPNPITNELVLIFCGYLSYSGTLNFYDAVITAIVADFLGSALIFILFFSFGKWLIAHSPKWFPISGEKMEKMKERVLARGYRGIFIGRLTPIIRGYVSVAAGLLNISRKKYTGMLLVSAIVWNVGLLLIGVIAGPYWKTMINKGGIVQNVLIFAMLLVAIIFIGRFFLKRQLVGEEKK